MKFKRLNILTLTAALFLTTACDDFLDTETLSSNNLEYLCSNPTDAQKMLNHAYSLFCEDPYTSRMSNNWMQNTDVEYAPLSKANAIASDRRGVWALNASDFNDIKNCWDNNYSAIDFANQIIEGVLASDMYKTGDADMKQILAEAYCLRAYRYFLLCNFWGDVPFATQATKYGVDSNTPRVDKNIIYSHIIQDLINVEEQMKWAEQMENGPERMNREFALGFISKLALFRAGYSMQKDGSMKRCQIDGQIDPVNYTDENGTAQTAATSDDFYKVARAYAKKLMKLKDRALPTDFGKIFKDQVTGSSQTNSDVLFEMGFVRNGGGDVGWCIGANVYASSKGAGKTYTYLSPKYATSFDTEDQRWSVTCEPFHWLGDNLQNADKATLIAPSKWNRIYLPVGSDDKNTGINWPILRYADVLLMFAEAENAITGPTEEAKAALKRVRERAFAKASNKNEQVNTYVNQLNSPESFQEAIVNERAWEFGGECIRKFDLIRWNRYSQAIAETVEWMMKTGVNAQQLEIESDGTMLYRDKQEVEDMGIASVLYFTFKNGKVEFINDMKTTIDENSDSKFKNAETIKDGDIKNGYTSEEGKVYKVDFAKSFVSVSDKDASTGGAYGTDEDGKTIKKGTFNENLYYSWYGLTDGVLNNLSKYEETSSLYSKVTPYIIPISAQKTSISNGVLDNNGWAIRNK